MSELVSPTTAESYRIHREGIDVDGQRFPWHVIAEPGPLVQRMEDCDDMHILWLPLIVDAALPTETAYRTTPADQGDNAAGGGS